MNEKTVAVLGLFGLDVEQQQPELQQRDERGRFASTSVSFDGGARRDQSEPSESPGETLVRVTGAWIGALPVLALDSVGVAYRCRPEVEARVIYRRCGTTNWS